MKDTKMNIKTISIMTIVLASLTLSACSQDPKPDDVREISQDEKSNVLNAQTLPEEKAAPAVKPSMGSGPVGSAPVEAAEPTDKGTVITVPTVTEITVEKNEKVKLYAGQLTPGTAIPAVLFYSGAGQNNKTIDLGEVTVNAEGEAVKDIVIPANLSSGNYVISYTIDGALFTAPIKVG